MARRDILPAVLKYQKALADGAKVRADLGMLDDGSAELRALRQIYPLSDRLSRQIEDLETTLIATRVIEDIPARAEAFCNDVLPAMTLLRQTADKLETIVSADFWPLPTYGDLLFSV